MIALEIQRKGSSVIVGIEGEKLIKIPSQMYPLSGTLQCITHGNTAPFEESETTEKIREAFDSMTPGIGTCYTNTKTLIEALSKIGVKAVPYVGWLFLSNTLPVHHCFASVDNHILDLTIRPEVLIPPESDYPEGIDAAREAIADRALALRTTPNSKKSTFGQVSEYSICFASVCSPEVGLAQYKKLMKAYPKHPCYRNITENHMSKTQEAILRKLETLKLQ